jgi:UDP-galactopyranose mutase
MNDHVLEFWKLSHEKSHVLFLFYEDRKQNLDGEVKKVANFLGKSFTQEEIDKLCDHLSFDSMQKNPTCNYEKIVTSIKMAGGDEALKEKFQFIREGKVGGHKKEMTEDEIQRFDLYMMHSEFKKHGFAYKL